MDKVAFLALTYGGFQQSQLWNRFFLETERADFNLYIHPCSQPAGWEHSFCLPLDRQIPQTGWAQFAAVQATIELMRIALEDNDNKQFILISDSHCPLYSIGSIIDYLKAKVLNKQIYFSKEFFRYPDNIQKAFRVLSEGARHPFNFDSFRPVSQWFACGRNVVEHIVSQSPHVEEYFEGGVTTFVEEVYFKLMADVLGFRQIDRAFCHVEWDKRNGTSGKFAQEYGLRPHPKTFDVVDQALIDRLRGSAGLLFFRKVHEKTEFRINIKDILIENV